MTIASPEYIEKLKADRDALIKACNEARKALAEYLEWYQGEYGKGEGGFAAKENPQQAKALENIRAAIKQAEGE